MQRKRQVWATFESLSSLLQQMSGKGRMTGAVSLGSQVKTQPILAGEAMDPCAAPILSVGVGEG